MGKRKERKRKEREMSKRKEREMGKREERKRKEREMGKREESKRKERKTYVHTYVRTDLILERSGSSQPSVTSQWLSRKVSVGATAASVPATLARIKPNNELIIIMIPWQQYPY